MTFADWVAETRSAYESQPPGRATIDAAKSFYRGACRRTIAPHVGSLWWEREWDVLIILDGCRVDLARETLDAEVGATWSPASTSIDWITRHFAAEHRAAWADTAYVTANPFADHNTPDARSADLADKPLGHFDPVYKRAWSHDPIGTTPPAAVTDAAVAAPDTDRLIVHYMQPHQPFRSRPEWETVFSNLENLTTEVNQGGPDIWHRCREGELDRADVWAAYRDNLDWVWHEVQTRLLPALPEDASVVVTADHGNGLGEWGCWSHPPGVLAPPVRRVPVIEIDDTGPQRQPEPVTDHDAEAAIADQLEALGYR